jgi:hypothetical protein
LAEVPEEVVIAVEADDQATPKLSTIGRSFVLLGSNIALVTKALGIQSPILDKLVQGILLIGHVARAAAAAKTILAAITNYLTASQTAEAASTGASAAATTGYAAAAAGATAANYGLAASFAAVNAALGPIGWALIGLGLLAAGVAGYAMAGGFGGRGGGGIQAVGEGPYQELMVQINIANANMNTKRDVEETVTDMATQWYQQMRKYRH